MTQNKWDDAIEDINREIDEANKCRFPIYDDPHVKTILEALQIAKAMEWQPIETAPKDGTQVDVYISELQERYTEAHFCVSEQCWVWDLPCGTKRVMFTKTPPTHWMPLPQPPKETKESE